MNTTTNAASCEVVPRPIEPTKPAEVLNFGDIATLKALAPGGSMSMETPNPYLHKPGDERLRLHLHHLKFAHAPAAVDLLIEQGWGLRHGRTLRPSGERNWLIVAERKFANGDLLGLTIFVEGTEPLAKREAVEL